MTFIRNAWYAAGWSDEITNKPVGRTFLSEKVALYRTEDNSVVALGDVCPHRFAPMHKGIVRGNTLQCPYHGLQFSETGACYHNPHADISPPALKLKAYPLVERHEVVWIWMGDPALASTDSIPDFSMHTDPGYSTVHGYIHVDGAYQLVADNLLDLSHTQYLHATLTLPSNPDMRTEADLIQEGNTLITVHNLINSSPTLMVNFLWPEAPERIDALSGVRWQPPANMLLKTHFASRDVSAVKLLQLWGAELVTPETETTCHYFWSSSRDFRREDKDLDAGFYDVVDRLFKGEDGMMIGQVQANMGKDTDLIAAHPVILPTDKAAVRARLIVRKLIKAEAEAKAEIPSVVGESTSIV